jgi:hypothetical protein
MRLTGRLRGLIEFTAVGEARAPRTPPLDPSLLLDPVADTLKQYQTLFRKKCQSFNYIVQCS